ncbi:hypothetical protein F4677DRAFT_446830 [Hypoxylon crocopeplum]|nr:hypothetical protein F4677DRAFT_446830 [Hypoxylon crocopeplum]
MERAADSFTSRRSAARALPQFQLPVLTPPIDYQIPSMTNFNYQSQKSPFHSTSPSSSSSASPDSNQGGRTSSTSSSWPQHTQQYSNSNNLTSSAGVTGSDGISPLSSGLNSSGSQSSQSSQPGISLYGAQGTWPLLPGASSYTHNPMNHGGHAGLMQPNYNRSIYSPTGPAYHRSSQSPATADRLASSSYDSSPFTLPMPGGGTPHSTLLSQSSNQQPLQNPMMNSHPPGSQPPTPSTTAPSDSYSRASTAASSYYPPTSSSTPHQTSFPSFASVHSSPTQSSPATTGTIARGIAAISSHQQHSPMQAPYQNRPFPPYQPLPTMGGGAVLSNMTNPGGQMTLVGGMNQISHGYHPPGHLLSPHAMYSHGQQNALQDRPFKCDICPQSFNRNHDLKRHKRIHLAIKPFPCTYCDKSFSRKDALKARERLWEWKERVKRWKREVTAGRVETRSRRSLGFRTQH